MNCATYDKETIKEQRFQIRILWVALLVSLGTMIFSCSAQAQVNPFIENSFLQQKMDDLARQQKQLLEQNAQMQQQLEDQQFRQQAQQNQMIQQQYQQQIQQAWDNINKMNPPVNPFTPLWMPAQ